MLGHQFWILFASVLVFWTNLGVPDLWDEDEPKNAACAREMMQRGDWVVPTFNGELRTAKPVMLYWLTMASYWLFGISEFSARFSSALLGTGTALLTYHIARSLFTPLVGLWSGLLLVGSLMFAVSSRAATPDAPLIFFSTLALFFYVHSLKEGSRWFLPMYASMGLAVLSKGPVGVVLPTVVLVLFVWLSSLLNESAPTILGRLKAVVMPGRVIGMIRSLQPFMALAIVLAVALPWYVLVGLRTEGAWLAGFLGQHNVGRFMKPMEGHGGPVVYYLIAIMIGCFPWSIFLPWGIYHIWVRIQERRPEHRADLLISVWAGTYLLFFSLASTKLPSYVLPAYPPLAILVARALVCWASETKLVSSSHSYEPVRIPKVLVRVAYGSMILVGTIMLIVVPFVTESVLESPPWLGWVALIPIFGGAILMAFAENHWTGLSAGSLVITSLVFTCSLMSFASVQVDPYQSTAPLLSRVREFSAEERAVGSFGYFQPSLAYYAEEPVTRIKTAEQLLEFFQENEERVFVVVEASRYETLENRLPADVQIVEERSEFLKERKLLLLERPPQGLASQTTESRL